MKKKYKKGTIVLTDYFLEPGKYEEFEIKNFVFGGSDICVTLYNIRTQELYRSYPDLRFNIKKYNELFFTKNELRAKKLRKLKNGI